MEFKPHSYQQMAIDKIIDTPRAGLFLDMGLGKTVITLTAIDQLMNDYFEVSRVLVIAPLRVAEDTWSRESQKWDHLKHLRISKVLGSASNRRKALAKDADIYVINRENVVWLTDELSQVGDGWGFDMVVIDELSSFKSHAAKRFKALRKYITRSSRVVGLTGTPAPNGLIDLWSQIYLLDGGERLGTTISGFRSRYFIPNQRNQHMIYNYKPREEAEQAINAKISDICISMRAEDWLDMPERIDNVQRVKLSDDEMDRYNQFERDCYLDFLEGEVTAASAAALSNKLLQYSNGAMYLADGGYVETSNAKLDVLDEIIELSNGKPILCFYSYKHDLERIQKRFKFAKKLGGSEDIEKWNNGEIPLLLAHPAGAGHGLNLQAGGNIIVWFGLTWSLELYQQANARLYRQGQENAVIIHHLITEGTADESVLASLQGKKDVQDELLDSLKAKYGDKNKQSIGVRA
jgi:SNF2 family DNA or RNA helicase|nr:MAG TPA: Chromatin remodeling complex ATPase [Caudoviricetes sp.]